MVKKKFISFLLFLFPSLSSGSGFFNTNFGGSSANALSSGPEAIFWNPALLLNGSKIEILGGIAQHILELSYKKNYEYKYIDEMWRLERTDKIPSENLTNFPFLPYLGGTFKINNRMSTGIAIYPAFGSSLEWDDPDGYQRYHLIKGSILTLYVSPAFSFKVLPGIFMGFNVSYVRAAVETEKHQSFADIIGGHPEDPLLDALLKMHPFAGNGWNGGFGLAWLTSPIEMGLSYTLPLYLKLRGYIELRPLGDKARSLFSDSPAFAEGTLKTTFPQVLKFAIRWKGIEPHILELAFEYVNWAQFNGFHFTFSQRTSPFIPSKMDEEKKFYDAYSIKIIYRNVLFNIPFFFLAGYDTNSSSSLSQASDLPDFNKILSSLGTQFKIPKGFYLSLDLGGYYLIPRTIKNSAVVPPADGKYSGYAIFASINIRWKN